MTAKYIILYTCNNKAKTERVTNLAVWLRAIYLNACALGLNIANVTIKRNKEV